MLLRLQDGNISKTEIKVAAFPILRVSMATFNEVLQS
jgi:hypothetical protein